MNILALIIVILVSIIISVICFIFIHSDCTFVRFIINNPFLLGCIIGTIIYSLMMIFIEISLTASFEKYGVERKVEIVNLSEFKCAPGIRIEKISLIPKDKVWFYEIFGNNRSFVESYYQITNVEN